MQKTDELFNHAEKTPRHNKGLSQLPLLRIPCKRVDSHTGLELNAPSGQIIATKLPVGHPHHDGLAGEFPPKCPNHSGFGILAI